MRERSCAAKAYAVVAALGLAGAEPVDPQNILAVLTGPAAAFAGVAPAVCRWMLLQRHARLALPVATATHEATPATWLLVLRALHCAPVRMNAWWQSGLQNDLRPESLDRLRQNFAPQLAQIFWTFANSARVRQGV
jgi:hypothetical protein